jgi:hypothetical protein
MMLDKENEVREQLLEWFMFDLSVKRLNLTDEKNLKPKSRESDRIYLIEHIE